MASKFPEIGLSLVMDSTEFDKDLKKKMKTDIDPVKIPIEADTASVKKLEKSIQGLADKTVDIDVDVANISNVKGELDKLKEDIKPSVKPSLEAANLGDLIRLGARTFTPKIDPQLVKGPFNDLSNLDSQVFTPDIKPTVSGLESAKSKIEGIKAKITATTDANVGGAKKAISVIKAPKIAIDATFDKAQASLDGWISTLTDVQAAITLTALLPENLGDLPFIGFAFDLNTAITQFDAATGVTLGGIGADVEDIGGIITRTITGRWADSAEEAAGYAQRVLEITQNAGDLEKNMVSVFEAATGTGEDFETVLRAMNTLVAGGFATDFDDAANIITVGFQGGLNASDDFLDTLIEYSKIFEGMGLSAEQVLTFLSQGFGAGVFTGDKIADVFKEADIRIKDVVDDASAVSEALDKIDFRADALAFVTKEEGALAGDEFWAEFAARINAGLESGEINFIDAVELLGTPFEDITQDVFAQLNLDPGAILPQFTLEGREGAATTKATEFFSDAQTALDTLLATIQIELSTTLAEALDLEGFINTLTEGIGEFSSLVTEGESLAVAIEEAFKIEGFAQTVADLESGLANFLIGILEFISNLPGADPRLKTEVTRRATGQLPFDVASAGSPEQLAGAVSLAFFRGVSEAKIAEIIQEEIDKAAASGLGEGSLLLQNLRTAQVALGEGGFGFDPVARDITEIFDVDTSEIEKQVNFVTAQYEAALAAGDLEGAIDLARLIGDESLVKDVFDILQMDIDLGFAELNLTDPIGNLVDTSNTALGKMQTEMVNTANKFTESDLKGNLVTAGGSFTTFADGAFLDLDKIIKQQDAITNRISAMSSLVDAAAAAAATGIPPPTPTTQRRGDSASDVDGGASGGSFPGPVRVHENELLMTGPKAQDIAVLNAQTSSTVLSGLGQLLGGMGLGAGSTTNNSRGDTNITINTAGSAENVSALNSITNAQRGF